jgi:hypothetical protein
LGSYRRMGQSHSLVKHYRLIGGLCRLLLRGDHRNYGFDSLTRVQRVFALTGLGIPVGSRPRFLPLAPPQAVLPIVGYEHNVNGTGSEEPLPVWPARKLCVAQKRSARRGDAESFLPTSAYPASNCRRMIRLAGSHTCSPRRAVSAKAALDQSRSTKTAAFRPCVVFN